MSFLVEPAPCMAPRLTPYLAAMDAHRGSLVQRLQGLVCVPFGCCLHISV